MGSCSTRRLVVVVAVLAALAGSLAVVVVANLHDDWDVEWAPQNVRFTQDGNGLALSVASSSSTGCRLRTKKPFIYGTISSLIKLVPGNSAGTIATLYASTVGRSKHEEIDFEFIGNVAGRPYTINTNIYTADDPAGGGKEVQFTPWFDAAAGFHNYTISWTPCMVAWYVDGVPIRVFRNYDEARDRVAFPRTQPMYGFLSIWQTDGAWATHNGASRTDWSKAPFVASYRRVDVGGGGGKACRLSPAQLRRMQAVQRKYKGYDYCNNRDRFKGHMPPECSLPQF